MASVSAEPMVARAVQSTAADAGAGAGAGADESGPKKKGKSGGPAVLVTPDSFVPEHHFYPRVLGATIHPIVATLFSMTPERIIKRYCHLHPDVDPAALSSVLTYRPRHFRWAGCDLFHVTTSAGNRHMVRGPSRASSRAISRIFPPSTRLVVKMPPSVTARARARAPRDPRARFPPIVCSLSLQAHYFVAASRCAAARVRWSGSERQHPVDRTFTRAPRVNTGSPARPRGPANLHPILWLVCFSVSWLFAPSRCPDLDARRLACRMLACQVRGASVAARALAAASSKIAHCSAHYATSL